MSSETTDRYVALPKPPRGYSFSEWGEAHPTMQVLENDRAPVDTGLLDAQGVRLFRVSETVPVGFHTARKTS